MYHAAHVSITTTNIDKSYSFYRDIFGFEAIGETENDELKIININAAGLVIELLERKNTDNNRPYAGPVDHIAFYIDNFDDEYERLIGLGVKMLLEAPKYHKGKKLMFFAGPDGERIEIMEK